MASSGDTTQTLIRALVAAGIVVVVGGLALVFFGFGADMSDVRTVTMVVRRDNVMPETAAAIQVGDPIYADIAGSEIGRVAAVEVTAQPMLTADAQGAVHVVGDPRAKMVTVTIKGPGRTGDGLIAIGSQVVQVGRGIMTISKRYNWSAVVVSVDVD
jgi:hypothetical protein